MDNFSKSVFIGLAAAMLVFFLGNKLNREDKYSIRYDVDIVPDRAAPYTLSYAELKAMLKKRLDATSYKYEIKSMDSNTTRINLHGVTDTSIYHLLTSPGSHIQFRELYDIMFVKDMLTALIDKMKKSSLPKNISPAPKVKKDTTTRNEMAENLPDQPIEEAGPEVSLIEFSQPYTDSRGVSYSSEIGYVKLKDTASLMKLFHSPDVKAFAPPDLQLCFGLPDNKRKIKNEEDIPFPLYCVRTFGMEKALLENEDILHSEVNYNSTGQIEVSLKFTNNGANKWGNMTTRNVGRSIAVILNDVVITAPRVNEPVLDGSAAITGNYSAAEAKDLSLALRSARFPARLIVNDVEIKRENRITKTEAKLIMTAIVFLLTAVIAFFVFKTLKSS